MSGTVRVVVAGATGRTGSAVTRGLLAADGIEVVGAVAHRHAGEPLSAHLGVPTALQVEGDLATCLEREQPDVLVDFTLPAVAGGNALLALERGVRPVVGTTGLADEEVDAIRQRAQELRLGAAVIPNFSFGILLLSRFAREATRFFPKVEVVELHHDTKLDVPSGTALHLAEALEAAGARAPVPIHSVRLPGFVARHTLIFGGTGETLTLTHDSSSRDSFAPGVILAVRRVLQLDHAVFDLGELVG
ncbi:MAG: 4-hydroxy-tetrahydrodipicolinate reductase [Bacillota bacterium]|nr:4-hydroxy-tetrahydrodipicolinate reductase [Bacillota bacterium]